MPSPGWSRMALASCWLSRDPAAGGCWRPSSGSCAASARPPGRPEILTSRHWTASRLPTTIRARRAGWLPPSVRISATAPWHGTSRPPARTSATFPAVGIPYTYWALGGTDRQRPATSTCRRPAADKRRRAHRPSDEQPAHPWSAAGSPASHAESGAATRRAPPGASPSSPYGSCRSGWRRCRCAPRTAPGRTPPSRHWASLYEPAPAAHRRSRPALDQAARPAAGSAPASSAGAHSRPVAAPAPRPQSRE